MKQTWLKIETQDGGSISAILYSSDRKKNIVVIVHGACMNFLEGISDFLPQKSSLCSNYDFLSINMRAHDLGYITDNYTNRDGWAWQSIQKNRFDIHATISYLIKGGYTNIVLCGHSWGGLVILDFLNEFHFKQVEKVVLLSPTVSFRLLLEVNYRENVEEIIAQARNLAIHGMENSIMPTNVRAPLPFFSVKTICEFASNDFNIQNFLEKVQLDTDIIVGGLEHRELQKLATNLEKENGHITSHILKKTNHFYTNHENEVVSLIDSIIGSC